jgi:hypothetical protein
MSDDGKKQKYDVIVVIVVTRDNDEPTIRQWSIRCDSMEEAFLKKASVEKHIDAKITAVYKTNPDFDTFTSIEIRQESNDLPCLDFFDST